MIDKFGVLRISWYPHGHMELAVKGYFPCTVQWFKKLLKAIELDREGEETLCQLKGYFRERLRECEENRLKFAKSYRDNKQFEADTARKVDSGKHPSGVKLTDDEMRQARDFLKNFKGEVKTALSRYKECERDKKSFERLIEILEKGEVM